jgi:tRNA(Ile)-lysidine synthase TilS/MesJ
LFRGAGGTGLAAIREIFTRRVDNVELTIVRPFLRVCREEINAYIGEHGLRFREDPTNKNLDPLRNRIRHQIIPYLEKPAPQNSIRLWKNLPELETHAMSWSVVVRHDQKRNLRTDRTAKKDRRVRRAEL